MAGRLSKKQLILESRDRRNLKHAVERDLRGIQREVRSCLAPGSALSLSYIASVLKQAGTVVDYEDRYTDPEIPERYAGRLAGVLRFDDLAAAEAALRSLDGAHSEYQSATDRTGVNLVRKLALRGRQRAESLAGSPRVSPPKRAEKREIALWFKIWLESPSLFFNWLEMRKRTAEFESLFPNAEKQSVAATPP